jgi:phage/plasmid-like protein (TIGR03299 family)
MAHNLEKKSDGTTSFASTEKAWHNLGQIVDGAMTSEEAIKLANLDYEVALKPVTFDVDKGHSIIMPDKFVTYRKDINMPLGVVGNRYNIVQNVDAFEFFDSIVGGKLAMFETAGVLGNGERIFVSAKMPEVIQIAGTDDVTEVYVLLTSSHDGSGSIIAAVTPVRVVCQNTLNAALKNTVSRVAIRHTTSAQKKLADAHKLLGISHKYITEVNEMFNVLAKKTVTDAQVKKLVEELFKSEKEDSTRIKNIREAVMASYFEGVGQSQIIGTAWGAYNGVTHYLDHVQTYRTGDVKFDSLMDGASAKVQNEAFAKLIAL